MTLIELLTVGLLVVTAIYAWLTFRMTKAAELSVQVAVSQVEAATRPYVSVTLSIHPGSQVFSLNIINAGRSAAEHLRLRLDRDFFQEGERTRANVAELPAFQRPIDHFGPGASLSFELAQASEVFGDRADESLMPTRFVVSASYSFWGKSFVETTHLDLRPYVHSSLGVPADIERLEAIRDQLERIARPLDGIRSTLLELLRLLRDHGSHGKGSAN